jgi:hypothetical protein
MEKPTLNCIAIMSTIKIKSPIISSGRGRLLNNLQFAFIALSSGVGLGGLQYLQLMTA